MQIIESDIVPVASEKQSIRSSRLLCNELLSAEEALLIKADRSPLELLEQLIDLDGLAIVRLVDLHLG
jgi:hypothetical protein